MIFGSSRRSRPPLGGETEWASSEPFAGSDNYRGPYYNPAAYRHGRGFIGKALTRMTRYTEILSILLRYGFGDFVRKVDHGVYKRLRGTGRDSRRATRTWSRPERMRRALEELGPTFIKGGQLLSHRPDILPREWIVEFGKLRHQVPPVGPEGILKIVEKDLGASPEEIFESFDPVPVASASIAQVYRARLKTVAEPKGCGAGDSGTTDEKAAGSIRSTGPDVGGDGVTSGSEAAAADNCRDTPPPDGGDGADRFAAESEASGHESSQESVMDVEVAVKIQRPGIRRIIEADLAILRDMARIVEKRNPSLAVFHLVDSVRELERALLYELDFRNEADNLETFRRNFADDAEVTAPKPFREYSSRRILTMEWLDGIPVGDEEMLDKAGVDCESLAHKGAEAVLRQIFEHRFFHADPHGGNIFVLENGVIAFLDFGQAGSLLPSQRLFLVDLLSALIRNDAPRAVRAVLNLSGYRDPEAVRHLTADIEMIIERYLTRPFGRLEIGEMVASFFDMVRRYNIEIPTNFYLLAKALATIEDIAGNLNPDFDFLRATRPFVKRMIRKELSPGRIAEQLSGVSTDTLRFLRDFPGEMQDMMSLVKSGKFRVEFVLKDMDKLDSTVKRTVTRLAAAVLLAAMIMGSSLLVLSGIPPLFYRVPVIGILGFLISGVVAVVLLIDLWRHH